MTTRFTESFAFDLTVALCASLAGLISVGLYSLLMGWISL